MAPFILLMPSIQPESAAIYSLQLMCNVFMEVSTIQDRTIIAYHFSGPGRAIGLVYVPKKIRSKRRLTYRVGQKSKPLYCDSYF